MATSILRPIIEPLRSQRQRTLEAGTRIPVSVPCGHCETTDAAWPVRLSRSDGPLVCVRCGGLLAADGSIIEICTVCAMPGHRGSHDAAACSRDESVLERLAASPRDRDDVSSRAAQALASLHEPCPPGDLDEYLGNVLERVGLPSRGSIVFIDLGEPAVAMLPGGEFVMTLGLLAALEDEAQLAFVLAREVALERAGWVWRRYGSAWRRRRGLLYRLGLKGNDPMVAAVDLSLQLGYGPEAERGADRAALASLVHADYDPGASVRALRLLESAALAGSGGRFLLAADRAAWLEESSVALGRAPTARLNREVYRRAVDGFSVFSR